MYENTALGKIQNEQKVYRKCDQVTWEEYRDFVQAFRDAVRKVEVHLLLKMVKDVVLVSGRI